MKQTVLTHSPGETEDFGARLAARLGNIRCIALFGDLGAGKTTLTRGIARGLGIDGVASPTYTIVNEYTGTRRLCHFDMYRITDAEGLYDIGWEDYLASGALCVIEWSENVEEALPPDTLRITLSPVEEGRQITVEYKGGECL